MSDQPTLDIPGYAISRDPLDPDWEVPTPIDLVMRLTRKQREQRVERLVEMSQQRFREALEVEGAGKRIAATCLLVSGGNDSYTVAHLFREHADYMVHANTGTGIEATREHVRATAAAWGLPLLEVHPKVGQGYREMVLGEFRSVAGDVQWTGFPGPAGHAMMYRMLKERGLRQVPKLLGISGSATDRVVFVAGRRRAESERRSNVPHHDTRGTMLWASPITVWHKADLRAYRLMVGDVPVNPVAEVLGMSGECGCLANAKEGERERWMATYPDEPFLHRVLEWEEELARTRPDLEPYAARWGMGWLDREAKRSTGGTLCGPECGRDPLLDMMDPLFKMDGHA
jgi:3'-phosphoadenosine 5'-phosphosulfate sulfotransferase (PAPS reductase)/FAD synthetase